MGLKHLFLSQPRAGLGLVSAALVMTLASCGGSGDPTYTNDLQKVGAQLPSSSQIANAPKPLIFGGAGGSSVDLSTSPYLPPVGDQQQMPSCTAWATGYGMASYEAAKQISQAPSDDSRRASAIDLFVKTRDAEGVGCSTQDGTYPQDALDIMTRNGVATLAQVPYVNGCIAASSYHSVRINGSKAISPSDSGTIKAMLTAGHPVAMAADTYTDFQNWGFSHHDDSVYSGNGQVLPHGGHCMLVVGYDDSKQAYKIMNSWGTSFGNQGFFWMSYHTFSQVTAGCYVADSGATIDATDPGPTNDVTFNSIQAIQYQSLRYYGYSYLVMPFDLSSPFFATYGRITNVEGGSSTPWVAINNWMKNTYVWWAILGYYPAGHYKVELQGRSVDGSTMTISATAQLTNGGGIWAKGTNQAEASDTIIAPLIRSKTNGRNLAIGSDSLFNGISVKVVGK